MACKAHDVQEQMDALGDIALTCNLKIGTFHEERILREVVLINAKQETIETYQEKIKKKMEWKCFLFLGIFLVGGAKNDSLHNETTPQTETSLNETGYLDLECNKINTLRKMEVVFAKE